MNRDVLILLVIGAAAYWFLFKKVETVKVSSVPQNQGTNPTAGKTQEAPNDVFGKVLDIIKGGLEAFNSNSSAAQSSANRYSV